MIIYIQTPYSGGDSDRQDDGNTGVIMGIDTEVIMGMIILSDYKEDGLTSVALQPHAILSVLATLGEFPLVVVCKGRQHALTDYRPSSESRRVQPCGTLHRCVHSDS